MCYNEEASCAVQSVVDGPAKVTMRPFLFSDNNVVSVIAREGGTSWVYG